jgi:hypothetical protein
MEVRKVHEGSAGTYAVVLMRKIATDHKPAVDALVAGNLFFHWRSTNES